MSQLYQSSNITVERCRLMLVGMLVCSALLVASCIPNSSDDEPAAARPPVIAYGEPVVDTIANSLGASRIFRSRIDPVSTGGPVIGYRIEPTPESLVTFDTATGRVSYTLDDGFWNDWEDYLIVAVGPGGADTVTVSLPVDPEPIDPRATLVVNIGLRSTNSSSLVKASALTLSKLIITLTSSSAADAVLRDTIFASETVGSQLSPVAAQDQAIMKSYLVKPLRSWTVEVKSLDVNGTVIHQGCMTDVNVLVGETRAMTLNLGNRYRPHVAKFALPDTLYSSDPNVQQKQALNFKRLVLTINGDTVRDTTAPSRFTSMPTTHILTADYVPADTAHRVGLYVYAEGLGSWPSSRPVYGGVFTITNSGIASVLQLPWIGPGSSFDPNVDPINPGEQITPLTVQYGPASQVVVNPPIDPNPLPRRAAAQ